MKQLKKKSLPSDIKVKQSFTYKTRLKNIFL